MWPDYLKRETLAKRMNIEPGYVDQLVKRGVIPPPHKVGEALLFSWVEVDNAIRAGNTVESLNVLDPYMPRGPRAVAEAPPSRPKGHQ